MKHLPPYDIFFWSIISFLGGVFLASCNVSLALIIMTALLLGVVFIFVNLTRSFNPSSIKSIVFIGVGIVGSVYYFWDDSRLENQKIIFNEKISFQAEVIDRPEISLKSQKLKLRLAPPSKGNVLGTLARYPKYGYGDILKLEGVIEKPREGYADYLRKERINGIISFPEKTELVAENNGNPLKSVLFRLKDKLVVSLEKALPPEPAALLAGITLGEEAEFTKEFKEAMAKSGTSHLTALSGYNISIVGITILGLMNHFFQRKISLLFSSLVIIAFILMTGAQASTVRAGLMGLILILAGERGRTFDFRNIIAFAGFLMVLTNPKILRFDLGFQLSFLALIGIIYLGPILKKFIRFEILNTTVSAELAVAPLIIYNFSYFPLPSVLSNLLILPTVPAAMLLGFLVAAASFISYHLSLIFAWFASLVLNYQVFIINLFGS